MDPPTEPKGSIHYSAAYHIFKNPDFLILDMRRAAWVVMVVAFIAASGCFGSMKQPRMQGHLDSESPIIETVLAGCGGCFEPTVAWGANGTLFVVLGNGQNFSASEDGGQTFHELLPPPLPTNGAGPILGDVILQVDPEGSLWWSAVLARAPAGAVQGGGMQVARSDDGGRTWVVNVAIGLPGGLNPEVDRNWLGFASDGRVAAVCTCPEVVQPSIAISIDRGAHFGALTPLPTLGGIGPVGPPAWGPDGLIIPYHMAPGAASGPSPHVQAEGVAVVRQLPGSNQFVPTVVAIGAANCCFFPSSSLENGTYVVAWNSAMGPRIATSKDGGSTWAAPVPVSQGTGQNDPWVVARHGMLAVGWLADNATGLDYRVAVGAPAGPFHNVMSRAISAPSSPTNSSGAPAPGNTDFPSLAWSPDGRLATVWSDRGLHIWVASPPTS